MRQVIWLAAVLAVCAYAMSASAAERTHSIEPYDYFTIGVVVDCATSPDGKSVVYTELRWEPPADKRNLDLWVISSKGGDALRLTFDPAADSSPTWSPDGKWVYFTSARERSGETEPPYNGKTQVWRISPEGGPMSAVTRVKDGISSFELSKDGRTLYYVTGEQQIGDEWKELREKHKEVTYGHGVVEFSQLWELDLVGWRAEKLIDDKRVIREFAVSPDGARVAMLTTPTEKLIHNEGQSRVDVWERDSGETITLPDRLWRDEAPSPYGWLGGVAWSRDGEALAFGVDFDGYPSELFAAELDGAKPQVWKLARAEEVHAVTGHLEWRGDTRDLCFVAEQRARARVYSITGIRGGKQGSSRVLTPGDVCVGSFSLSEDGKQLAAVLSTIKHPPDVFTTSVGSKDLKRLTTANPQVDTWKIPQIELVTWKGANGDKVEGILELPPDYQEGDGPLPMILELHGGPTAASQYRFRFWIYGRVLWAARGYAVFSPNYRGSTGYGDKFLTELVGHKNDIDIVDIMNGVDAMIEQGIADPDRLGVMGWSNGGYLTNCLITRTDRFKAASSGAGILDLAMQWAAEDTPGHVVNFQQGLPWERPDKLRAASPLWALNNVKTPTIVHVGEKDTRCPPAHSTGLYRALHEYLGVPCQLLIYPGEGHSPMTYKNRKAKLDWDTAWFDKYLPLDEQESVAGEGDG